MSQNNSRKQLEEAHRKALDWFDGLSGEEKKAHLKAIGILDDEGHLAKEYGGNGAKSATVANQR